MERIRENANEFYIIISCWVFDLNVINRKLDLVNKYECINFLINNYISKFGEKIILMSRRGICALFTRSKNLISHRTNKKKKKN